MVGAIDAEATMTSRLTLRYRTPVADHDQLLAAAGRRVTGHEFHRTVVEPTSGAPAAWLVDGEPSASPPIPPVWAPRPCTRATCTCTGPATRTWPSGSPMRCMSGPDAPSPAATTATGAFDLRHHGDQDIADGLVDLAVNVRIPAPPDWLAAVINQATPELAGYPRSDEAGKAIAAAHGLALDQVLPTAGGAEAFTLLARALRPRRPVVVHPQFTEPEAALLAAGHRPERVILDHRTASASIPT